MADKKEDLVKKALGYGLGTEEFLSKLSVENLSGMVGAFDKKDSEIKSLKETKKDSVDMENITTVQDLVKNKRIDVAGVKKEEK